MDVFEGIRRRRVLPVLVLATGVSGGGCSEERADRYVAQRDAVETAASAARAPSPVATTREDSLSGAMSDTSAISATMSAVVSAQIDTLLLAEPRDLRGSLRRHQKAVRALIASFDADMRALHLDDHPEWPTRLEQLQSQVRLMEDMSVDELHAFLPEYRANVAALVRLHASLRRSPRP